MLDPIRALLASSFSKKGIIAEATETSCLGETSINSISSGLARPISPSLRTGINSPVNAPFSFNCAFACAIVYLPSSIAETYKTVSVTIPFLTSL